MLEKVLHDAERGLDLRMNARLRFFDLVEQLPERRVWQNLAAAGLHSDLPGHGHALVILVFLDTDVAGVTMNSFLLPVQQRMRLGDVVDVGPRAEQCENDTTVGVDSDVRRHAKVPLIQLLRLMHVRVRLHLLVLHRWRCGDGRRVDDDDGKMCLAGKPNSDVSIEDISEMWSRRCSGRLTVTRPVGRVFGITMGSSLVQAPIRSRLNDKQRRYSF